MLCRHKGHSATELLIVLYPYGYTCIVLWLNTYVFNLLWELFLLAKCFLFLISFYLSRIYWPWNTHFITLLARFRNENHWDMLENDLFHDCRNILHSMGLFLLANLFFISPFSYNLIMKRYILSFICLIWQKITNLYLNNVFGIATELICKLW